MLDMDSRAEYVRWKHACERSEEEEEDAPANMNGPTEQPEDWH